MEWKRKAEFVHELAVRVPAVRADSEDVGARLLKRREFLLEFSRLCRAPGCVVFGIEEQHDGSAFQRGESYLLAG